MQNTELLMHLAEIAGVFPSLGGEAAEASEAGCCITAVS